MIHGPRRVAQRAEPCDRTRNNPYVHTLCAALATPIEIEAAAITAARLDRVPELFLDALFIAMQLEKGRAG